MINTRSLIAALASGAALFATTAADAALVSSGWPPVSFGPGSTLNLDVNHDGSTDVSLSSFASYVGTDYWGNNYFGHQVTVSAAELWQPVKQGDADFHVGVTPGVGSSLTLVSNTPILSYGLRETQWRCNGHFWGCEWYLQYYYGYAHAGTSFNNDNLHEVAMPFAFDNGGNTNYGWLDIRTWMYPDNQYGGQVRYHFDDSGAPVVASIPEPETYAMMLAGLGLLAYVAGRRKSRESTRKQ